MIHPTEDRALTIREAARLQSFPDDYQFHGSDESVRLQIGNAVPPLLAMHLGLALKKHLEDNGVIPKPMKKIDTTPMAPKDLPWYVTFK